MEDIRTYYLAIDGEVKGPYAHSQLRSMWESGAITAESQVCESGSEDWQRASKVIEPGKSAPADSVADVNAVAEVTDHPGMSANQSQTGKNLVTIGTAICIAGVLMMICIPGTFWKVTGALCLIGGFFTAVAGRLAS